MRKVKIGLGSAPTSNIGGRGLASSSLLDHNFVNLCTKDARGGARVKIRGAGAKKRVSQLIQRQRVSNGGGQQIETQKIILAASTSSRFKFQGNLTKRT